MNARTNLSAVVSALPLIVLAGSAIAEPSKVPTDVLIATNAPGKPVYNPDYNHSGKIDVQDIFDYLTGWFAGKQDADVNGNGVLEGLDVLEYINAWFAYPSAAATK